MLQSTRERSSAPSWMPGRFSSPDHGCQQCGTHPMADPSCPTSIQIESYACDYVRKVLLSKGDQQFSVHPPHRFNAAAAALQAQAPSYTTQGLFFATLHMVSSSGTPPMSFSCRPFRLIVFDRMVYLLLWPSSAETLKTSSQWLISKTPLLEQFP